MDSKHDKINTARLGRKCLLYVEVSICSGSSLMSTSNLSCTFTYKEQECRLGTTHPTSNKQKTKRMSEDSTYLVKNIRVRGRGNESYSKPLGAKTASPSNLNGKQSASQYSYINSTQQGHNKQLKRYSMVTLCRYVSAESGMS
jgi:hypothetical protein